jgi:hypothetical protein
MEVRMTRQCVRSDYPCSGLDRPRELQVVEATRSFYGMHMKVARLSALHTGRLCLQGRPLVLVSVRCWIDFRAIVRPEALSRLNTSKISSGIAYRLGQCVIWLIVRDQGRFVRGCMRLTQFTREILRVALQRKKMKHRTCMSPRLVPLSLTVYRKKEHSSNSTYAE